LTININHQDDNNSPRRIVEKLETKMSLNHNRKHLHDTVKRQAPNFLKIGHAPSTLLLSFCFAAPALALSFDSIVRVFFVLGLTTFWFQVFYYPFSPG